MKKFLVIIGIISCCALGALTALTVQRQNTAADSFRAGGYILDSAVSPASGGPSAQYYFNSGTAYSENGSTETLSFKTISGDSVSVGKESFIHYNDDSMEALTKTVLYDTDQARTKNQGYYSIPSATPLKKNNDGYTVDVSGNVLQMDNMIWKISEGSYMVVSDEVELVVSEDSRQTFPGYVQVEYGDSGIVYLQTQQGTYSTVSSEAYLELANGVRVYLGSKNVSTENAIISNISQLVVNSQDLIEANPDDTYNNTSDDTPQIIVEASDGKNGDDGEDGDKGADGDQGTPGDNGEDGDEGEPGDKGADGDKGSEGDAGDDGDDGNSGDAGKAGTAGTNGANGTNGNGGGTGSTGTTGSTGGGGNPGEEGDAGDPGNNATTANVTYQEEKTPIFWMSVSSDCYSISSTVSYNDEETQVDTSTTTVTLYETSSGLKIKSVTPGTDIVKASGFDVKFDELTPGVDYTMVVTTDYTTVSGTKVTRDVASKYCSTQSIGMSLVPYSATDASITAMLAKTEEAGIKSVSVILYDENRELMTGCFMIPTGVTYDVSTGAFDVETLKVNGTIEMTTQQFGHNTACFAQIVVREYLPTVTTENQKYTFPMVALSTLKTPPTLEAPEVQLSGSENAFVISPKRVSDPDYGVVSYRYEIFTEDQVVNGQLDKAVWTVNSSSAASVKALIDGDPVSTNVRYQARLIARFNNNSQVIDYASAFSDVFWLDPNSAWPKIEITEPVVSPSTAEGTVTVIDNSGVLSRGENRLHLKIYPHNKDLYKPAQKTTPYVDAVYTWYSSDGTEGLSLKDSTDQKFVMDYQALGLAQDTTYDIKITVDYISVNGTDRTSELLAASSFTTDSYTGVKMNMVDVLNKGSDSVKAYIYFSSADWAADDAKKDVTSGIAGVTDFSHFSSKSMQYLKLSLKLSPASDATVYGTAIFMRPDGYAAKKDPAKYEFVKNDAGSMDEKYKSLRFNRYWEKQSTTEIDEQYCVDNSFGLLITLGNDSSKGTFENNGSKLTYNDLVNQAEYQGMIYVTAQIYDYTYMDGSSNITWIDAHGDALNQIPCAETLTFTLGNVPPNYKNAQDKYQDESVKTITKNDVLTESSGALLTAYKDGTQASNYQNFDTASGTLEAVRWQTKRWGGNSSAEDEMKNSTKVGVKAYGTSALRAYAAEVRYTVYYSDSYTDQDGDQDVDTEDVKAIIKADPTKNIVAQSGWMVPTEQGSLPRWDYLLYADSNRVAGQKAYVRVENTNTNLMEDIEVSLSNVTVGRGDTFYISVEIKMNGTFAQTAGCIYPSDFFSDTAKKTAESTLTLKETINDSNLNGPVLKAFKLEKQIPELALVQWEGSTVTKTVTHLLMLNDLDNAILLKSGQSYTAGKGYRDEYEKIEIYEDDGTTEGTASGSGQGSLKLIANAGTVGCGDDDTQKAFPLQLAEITSAGDPETYGSVSNEKLYFLKYDDGSGTTGIIKLNESCKQLIQGSTVAIVDKDNYSSFGPDNYKLDLSSLKEMFGLGADPTAAADVDFLPAKYEDSVWSTYFYYDSSSETDLQRVDLELTPYRESTQTPGTYDPAQKGTPVLFSLTKESSTAKQNLALTGQGYQKDAEQWGNTWLHKATISLNVLASENSALTKLSGYEYVEVTVTAYFDSGSYGLSYVCKSGTAGRTGYYSTQERDEQKYIYKGVTKDKLGGAIFMIDAALPTDKKELLLYPAYQKYQAVYREDTDDDQVLDTVYQDLEYTNNGLSPLPREVGTDGLPTTPAVKTNLLKTIMPTYTATFEPGFSETRITLTFGSLGDVATAADGMFEVFYQEKTSTTADQLTDNYTANAALKTAGKAFSYTLSKDGTGGIPKYDSTVIANGTSGLKGNTEYVVRVFACANGNWLNLETKDKTQATVKEISFTTLERIILAWNESVNTISYTAATDNATTGKKVKIAFKVVDAYITDIMTSLGGTASATLSCGSAFSISILDAIKSNFPDDENGIDVTIGGQTYKKSASKQTYSFTVEANWSPGAAHIMDGTVYTFSTDITYAGGQTDKAVKITGTSPNYTYTKSDYTSRAFTWKAQAGINGNGSTLLQLAATKGYDTQESSANKGTFKVSITGTDGLRVFRTVGSGTQVASTDNVDYRIVLYEKGSGESEVQIAGSDRTINMKIQQDGTVVSNDSNENITVGYTYTQLTPGKSYKAKVYAAWDINNDGKVDSGEELEASTEWYEIPNEVMEFKSFSIQPSTSTAKCFGVNLEQVNKISYWLKINGVRTTEESVVIEDPSSDSRWSADTMETDVYNLYLAEMNSTSASYELVITLYSATNPNGTQLTKTYGRRN